MRVIRGRVRRKAAGGAVLEALIDRQDHQLAGAAKLAFHQNSGEVCFGTGIVAFVPIQDLLHSLGDAHGRVLAAVLNSVYQVIRAV